MGRRHPPVVTVAGEKRRRALRSGAAPPSSARARPAERAPAAPYALKAAKIPGQLANSYTIEEKHACALLAARLPGCGSLGHPDAARAAVESSKSLPSRRWAGAQLIQHRRRVPPLGCRGARRSARRRVICASLAAVLGAAPLDELSRSQMRRRVRRSALSARFRITIGCVWRFMSQPASTVSTMTTSSTPWTTRWPSTTSERTTMSQSEACAWTRPGRPARDRRAGAR